MPRPTRLHMVVVVVGGTVAIMALAFIQIALPIVFGLWGLATAMLIDLGVFLFFLRRQAAHRKPKKKGGRYPLIKWGPADRRYATRRVDALEKEITATAVVTGIVLLIAWVSWGALRFPSLYDWNVTVLVVAGVMLLASVRILDGLLFTPLKSESEYFDTTEDH